MQREETSCQSYKSKLWKEYPEKDLEYVRWYPPTLEPMSSDKIWEVQEEDDKEKEIAFYIHVPFCVSICKYCPFTKYIWRAEQVDKYLKALNEEIARTVRNSCFHNGGVVAGYLGGGTPTSLSAKQLADIMEECYKNFVIIPDAEMSIEANPDTVDEEKLRVIHSLGFNRISFGVQSFDDSLLKVIGRVHTSGQVQRVLELAHKVGFENICVDLLYGLPGQTLNAWERDLQQAVNLGAHHISIYCLYIAPGTKLHQEVLAGQLIVQPDEQQEIRLYKIAEEILGNAGYVQQTTYDFALPGKECRHHAINWRAPQGEYCGLGPGAFSHIRGHIYCNVGDVESYIRITSQGKLPVALGKRISRKEQMSRFMVLGMKYLSVEKSKFREIFGEELDNVFGNTLRKLEDWGLIVNNADRVTVTERGKVYIANISKAFYTEENKMQPQPRAPVWSKINHRELHNP